MPNIYSDHRTCPRVLAVLLLLVLHSVFSPHNSSGQWEVDNVSAGNFLKGIAINPVTNKIYIANEHATNSWVIEIDGATGDTAIIPVYTDPHALAVNPATNQIFVLCRGLWELGWVTIIDGSTHQTENIPISSHTSIPKAIVVNPVTNKAYVTGNGTERIEIIDGSSYTGSFIDAGGNQPWTLAVNPNTNKVFITMIAAGYGEPDSLWVINGEDDSYERTIPLGQEPEAIAVNPDDNLIYVANRNDSSVTIVDCSTWDTTLVRVKQFPSRVAVNPTTESPNRPWAWIGYDSGDTITAIVPGAEGQPPIAINIGVGRGEHSLAIDQNRDLLYVTHLIADSLFVLNLLDVESKLSVGSQPGEVVANPLTGLAYVVNQANATVTVIKGDRPVTYSTVAVGTYPVDVAYNPFTGKVYVVNSGGYELV
ncbi:MAG: YncE family protein [Candidatus Zixiibacteriota bacterium]